MNTELPTEDDGYKRNFFEVGQQIQEKLAKGETVPEDCMPHEHPLWIVLAAILGKKTDNTSEKDNQVSSELLRRLESSIQKMLKEPQATKKSSGDLPLYACLGISVCCLCLFVTLFLLNGSPKTASEDTSALSSLFTEMKTCDGPHVMRLKDGSCTLKIQTDAKGSVHVYSWETH